MVCGKRHTKKIVTGLLFLLTFLVIILYHVRRYKTVDDVILKLNPTEHQSLSTESGDASKFDVAVGEDVRIEDILNERKHKLREACQGLNLTRTMQTYSFADRKKLTNVWVLPELKTIYCAVPKVSSTSWKRLFLAAHGYPQFLSMTSNEVIGPHEFFDRKFKSNRLSRMSKVSGEKALKEYKSFMFVRNPYTRILSSFREKFHWPPTKYSEVFQSLVRNWILSHEPESVELNSTGPISFQAFMTYYLKAPSKDEHWEDMYKLCHPCTIDYDFIGHFETMESDTAFLRQNLLLDIQLPKSEESRKPSNSSNDKILAESYSQLSRYLMETFMKSEGIRRDCKLFGYSIPESIRRDR